MRIVICEDFFMIREALVKICRDDFGHDVIGQASNAGEAVGLCRTLKPDILLLDLVLQDSDGFSVIAELRTLENAPKVLVISAYCDVYTLLRLDEVGVMGYIDKQQSILTTVGEALERISQGRPYYSPHFQAAKHALQYEIKRLRGLLTPWECSILRLIGFGLNDEEIASSLQISPRTAQGHRSLIIRKLGVKGTPKLMSFARLYGFCEISTRNPRSRNLPDGRL